MTLVRLLAAALVVSVPALAAAADFVGPESCRTCHQAAYDQWRQSAHARAMASLSPEQRKDTRCLQCHARDGAQGGDAGVTCETCHGAGEYYAPEYVMRDAELARAAGLVVPDGKSCLLCHDASSPSLGAFDAAAKLKEIDHWSAPRAARAKKGTKSSEATCPRPSKQQALRAPLPAKTLLGRVLAARTPASATQAARDMTTQASAARRE